MPETHTNDQPEDLNGLARAFAQSAVLVVAAGRGSRAGAGLPKQYRPLAGRTVLRRTLEALMERFDAAHIHCVIHPDDRSLFDASVAGLANLAPPIIGGSSRQESVRLGLEALANDAPSYIFVHDGARPFVSAALMNRLARALLEGAAGVVPGLAVTDTIKTVDGAAVTGNPDRDQLRAVQTPQAFPFAALLDAHRAQAGAELTDDAAVLAAEGAIVHWGEGDAANIKLTHAEDFTAAERRLMGDLSDIRVGQGYDVHRFEAGDHVWLGGVRIAHDRGLKGHSDADVGLHALTDALLAALADGDIGAHFPPTDKRWRGEPSETFIRFAVKRVSERGGMIAHLGLLLICEAPKIGPHRDAMKTRIAELTNVPVDRISVQATTTEKLGFAGRGEGIAAQASATVRLPQGPGA